MKAYLDLNDDLYSYIQSTSIREHWSMTKQRMEVMKMPMSSMQSSPEITQFITLLIRLISAKNIIEIGVFTGYTTLGMALAIPEEGRIVACDVDEQWVSVGKPFWSEADVQHKIDLRIAPASETLAALLASKQYNFFDLIFIDADKENYLRYYEYAYQLVRPGGLIVFDNVLWGGSVIDERNQSDDVIALRTLNKKLLSDRRITLSMLHVGDGLTLVRKNN
jgi:predicted O-methyltransferase YrrM